MDFTFSGRLTLLVLMLSSKVFYLPNKWKALLQEPSLKLSIDNANCFNVLSFVVFLNRRKTYCGAPSSLCLGGSLILGKTSSSHRSDTSVFISL